jgi:hypothetical protein
MNTDKRGFEISYFRFLYLCSSVFICGYFLPGCAHNPPAVKQPYVGPTESLQQVVDAINQNNRRLPTLWAHARTMEISIVDDKGKRHEEVLGGSVLYRAPREVLVVGRKDVVGDIVQIGSNDDVYWLTAKDPGPDTAWWGRYRYLGQPCAKPIPVRPDLVLQVLGVSTIDSDLSALPAPVMRFNNDRDEYMLTWIAKPFSDRWVALKEIWYDRATKRPTHVMLFDPDGRVTLSAWLSQHKPVESPEMPKEQWPIVATDYRLYFPDSGSKLHLVLDDVKLNRKGAPNDMTFRFNADPKRAGVSKVIQLDEDCGP